MKKFFIRFQMLCLFIALNSVTTAQNIIIVGRVVDSSGQTPLPGVSISVQGKSLNTVTDNNGSYSLRAPDNSVLVFSSVGYNNKEVPVHNRKIINIEMNRELSQLGDVVVVGYGTQKKINLTGSVASIGQDKLANRPVTNISTALQGELPGVTVVQQSGQPGKDNGIIRIRGIGTMNDANPMIVVDGIDGASMEDLNPNDIESISVLKDASASAIYGSRAANGVILITTKRGKLGAPKIRYNGYIGKQKPTNLPDFLNSYEYAKLLNEGLKNEGASPKYSADEIEKFRTGSDPVNYPNTDWIDLFYKGSGLQEAHDINISGGNEASKYFISLGYLNQDGIIKKVNSDRFNVRLNLDSRISKHLTIGVTSSLAKQYMQEPSAPGQTSLGGIIVHVNRIPPTVPNKYADGTYTHYFEGSPIAWIEQGGIMYTNNYHLLANAYAELEIVSDLKLRGSFGVDDMFMDSKRHIKDITYGDGLYQGPNSVSDVNGKTIRIIPQMLLTYKQELKNHTLSGLIGASREEFSYTEDGASRNDFPSNDLTQLNAGSLTGMTNYGTGQESRLTSYFGRLNYGFENKYLLEVSGRYDGSSKFAENKRWGWFPSISAGWVLSKESFIKNIHFINIMKVRASYGSVGNNATGDYQYLNKISLGLNYPFGGAISSGAGQTKASSPNLQWEKSTTFDLGIDLNLFNYKLTFTADYYNRYTNNILIAVPVSAIFGLPAPTVNGGAMRNTGFEFLLGYTNKIGQFSYGVSSNIAFNKNETVKFPNPSKGTRIYSEGLEWGAFYGYQYIGLYQTDHQVGTAPKVAGTPVQKGDLMFKDQNGDGKINANDRVVLGSDFPGVAFGLNLKVGYKNFDLSLFGQGASKVKQLLNSKVFFPFVNGYKAQKADLDRWTPETPNAKNPVTHVTQSYNYSTISSFMVVNSDYVRLKSLQIGYRIPKLSLKTLLIDQVRIYVSGQNILTWTKLDTNRGFDPESPTDAHTNYPNVKTYTVGVNVTF